LTLSWVSFSVLLGGGVWAGRARFPRSLRFVLGCCPCVVPDQPGRLYSAVGRAVSIAAEGRLRL